MIPHTEETFEEKERVESNDPGMDVKKGRSGKFIPIEDVEDVEDKIIDENEENAEDKYYEIEETDEEKINKLKKELEEKPINFFQDNTDVAHVGPDFESSKNYQEENEDDKQKEFKVDTDEHTSFLNKIKSYLSKSGLFRKDYRRDNKKFRSSKDNLKTMPDSEKERMTREKLREMKRDNENYEDSYNVFDNSVETDLTQEKNSFGNDKEMKKLQKAEERKMNRPKDDSYRIGELQKIEDEERGI